MGGGCVCDECVLKERGWVRCACQSSPCTQTTVHQLSSLLEVLTHGKRIKAVKPTVIKTFGNFRMQNLCEYCVGSVCVAFNQMTM